MTLNQETLDEWEYYANHDVMDMIEVDDMIEAIKMLRALLPPDVRCGKESLTGDLKCQLEPGHIGAHMCTTPDGKTTVWSEIF